MSKEFIEKGYNLDLLKEAANQEDQLSYFLTSKLQDNTLNDKYFEEWAKRKYQSDDYFLNWIKSIFKSDNFLKAFKYLRYPLPSAKLVKNRIEPQLKRVFYAEDADFKYNVTGKTESDFIPILKIKEFNEELFEKLLYKHNSIVVEDLDSVKLNTPHRYFVDIHDVVSLQYRDNKITKIAFRGSIEFEGVLIDGYVYIDSQEYSFWDKDKKLVTSALHDLGHCPAHFATKDKYKGSFIVRQSLFTFIREELEEYTFLKTLQRMCEANGVIPVVSKLEVAYEDDSLSLPKGEPNSDTIMGSQRPSINSQNETIGTGDLEPGTIHEIPQDAIRDNDGKINMDVIKSFINFHYTPIEPIKYLSERIQQVQQSIITTMVGDVVSMNEESKNITQIEKSISVLEDTLTSLAENINRIRRLSDSDMLGLMYSPALVGDVFIHIGTDFFLESQTTLFDNLSKAPNSLERKTIIDRINKNKFKNNSDQLTRQKLLYDLMPYVSDVDFDKAVVNKTIAIEIFEYQTRFNYWISLFEANFGDIVIFYSEMEINSFEKLIVINNLILELINIELNKNRKVLQNENDQSTD